ncbi:MAG: EAL domain-containing protein [Rhodoferax sp.]
MLSPRITVYQHLPHAALEHAVRGALDWQFALNTQNFQRSGPVGDALGSIAALRIVLIYALFASLWILLSDRAVTLLFQDVRSIAMASMLKGWLFVAVTALLLFGLISRLAGGLQRTLETVRQRETDLQESEGLLLESQRIAGLGSYVLDISRDQWTSSPVCDQVFGIDAAYDRSVQGWVHLVHPDERSSMADYFSSSVLGQGQSFDREYRIVRPIDGAQRWVHGLGRLEFDAQGKPTFMRGTIQDITDKKHAQIAVESARNQLKATLDALPDLLFEVGRDGRIHDYHSHRSDLLAAPPEVFLGRRFEEVMPTDVAQTCRAAIEEAAEKGVSTSEAYALQLPQGERWFELSVARMPARTDAERHFILIARDITERRQSEEKLQLAARVFSHAREGITITNADGVIMDVNAAFTRITGYERAEAIGQNPRMLKSGRQDRAFYANMWRELLERGHWTGEVWNRRKNGEVFAELLTISTVRDARGAVVQHVALFSDITALKEHQNQLEHMAHFDALTNLPNRLLLADRLQQAMSQAQRRGKQLAVAYLDLDSFKTINDRHGHDVGDQLLVALAGHMKETLRDGDTLARMGGDEFVAVLIDLDNAAHSVPLLQRLLDAAARPVTLGGLELQVSASLGVTFFPQAPDMDADQLLRQADQGMYQAKLAGKNRYHIFDAEQDNSIRGHHESVERVRLAMQQGEFVLYYQPKVNMRSGAMVGVEALIRWQHPERGLLAPATFLPVIEDHPLAVVLGEWVIASALEQIELWCAAGLDVHVSVNIGARQLQQVDFADRLRAILAEHPRVSPSHLELEILETSALKDMGQVSRLIETCEEFGVQFALDDFGTGYSSLTYLKRLHVGLLKIDQSFVRDMLDDADDLAILKGVIGLAGAFRRQVIAEGVETVAHGTLLLELGCELAQGYGIARPMPAEALPAWQAQWQPDPAWRA